MAREPLRVMDWLTLIVGGIGALGFAHALRAASGFAFGAGWPQFPACESLCPHAHGVCTQNVHRISGMPSLHEAPHHHRRHREARCIVDPMGSPAVS